MDATEYLTFAVNGDVIVLFQGVNKVFGVSVADDHATEIIDN